MTGIKVITILTPHRKGVVALIITTAETVSFNVL